MLALSIWAVLLVTVVQSPINGDIKQLFTDLSLFDHVVGSVSIVINPLTKAENGPLILPDAPWETGTPHAEISTYSAVMEVDGITRVHYGSTAAASVAEAVDGLTFEKPLLGLVTVNGSDTNRLLGYVGDAVWEDPLRSLGAGARFVSQGAARTEALGRELTFSVSQDGYNWTIVSNWTCCNHPNSTCNSYDPDDKGSHCYPADGTQFWSCPGCDSQSPIFWDYRRQEYAMFTRAWVGVHGGGTAYRSVRRLSTPKLVAGGCRSPDGRNRVPADRAGVPEMCWSNDTIVMAPDAISNATHATEKESAPAIDYYGATVWQYPGVADGSVYFMFPERVWHYIGAGNTNPMPLPAEIDVGLSASRDGIHFNHIAGRQALLPLGTDGSFDSRMTWVLPYPIIRDDKIFVYYAGSAHNHNGQLAPGTPDPLKYGGISVAFARLDGFTSLDTVAIESSADVGGASVGAGAGTAGAGGGTAGDGAGDGAGTAGAGAADVAATDAAPGSTAATNGAATNAAATDAAPGSTAAAAASIVVTTKVMTFSCGGCVHPKPAKPCQSNLVLNLDSTTAHGMVRVALLDPTTSSPYPGFALNESVPMVLDSVRAVANWTTQGADLSALRLKPLRVQLEMTGSKLYSLQFVAAKGVR